MAGEEIYCSCSRLSFAGKPEIINAMVSRRLKPGKTFFVRRMNQ
ncbi:hypothetical protein SIAM614_10278 [Stappia aggregata IAM 12614]|uniref:Uncharacterized protein n=1 Tax=Roseibium aggregatum (strain ATCC 25650 / DSM 13394 / JCM 20685 / NBRC 16684 / NCIMB 2208 / IAM 12614 / B1) TaxID=384765 RepID=A0NMB3_ROSAI|nr:hypothetical protein SIAM614_10278 [Stappia aggregata IAM 12614] [Roseibium aggregatum IAM 12614]